MYIHRQYEKYSQSKLEEIYAEPHCHQKWDDHIHRVDVTIELGKKMGFTGKFIADLSCGDGAIAKGLSTNLILGDFAPGYPIRGPIEQTIEQIPEVEVFVLCETLEHVWDPAEVLHQIRQKTEYLLLSTPVTTEPDENDQHYWCWDRAGVEFFLEMAGFGIDEYTEAYNGMGYTFGVWVCG